MKKIHLQFLALALMSWGRGSAAELFTPATSSQFSKWTDPGGVVSYILKPQAPVQSTGYFTQKMYTNDGRYLWFIADGGGEKQRHSYLAVVDFQTDKVRLFPAALFDPSSPVVDLQTDDCYYIAARGSQGAESGWNVNRISPEGKITVVNRVPREPSEAKDDPRQVATHLTFNASHTALGFDCGNYRCTDHTYVGIIPLDGAPVVVWHVYDRRMDHAQMSPIDDNLIFVAQDYYDHVGSDGKTSRQGIDNRMWLLRKDGQTWPIFPNQTGAYNSHEWWDAHGQAIWFTDRKGQALGAPGTGYVDIRTGKATLVWPGATDISESSLSGRFLVGDNYKQWSQGKPVRLTFFDAQTKKTIPIASALPAPTDARPHQPNGHFELNDAWISYTTSIDGKIGLALSPTEPLKEAVR